MKKPITVTVEREHGNSGDVIMKIRGADGEERGVACPGDCSPYSALTGIRGQLEETLNTAHEPKDGIPFCILDPDTGHYSVMVGHTELGIVHVEKTTLTVNGEEKPATKYSFEHATAECPDCASDTSSPPAPETEPSTEHLEEQDHADTLIAAAKPSAGDA